MGSRSATQARAVRKKPQMSRKTRIEEVCNPRFASRVNLWLTHLSDPTGTALTLLTADGSLAGHTLYDAYGGVLSSTIPATLTNALTELPDADTGLVHLGGGRYYDPALGRPLQPNSAGGLPSVPQSLNRYAASALGQPGVGSGEAGNAVIYQLLQAGVNQAPGIIAGGLIDLAATATFRTEIVEQIALRPTGRVIAEFSEIGVGNGQPLIPALAGGNLSPRLNRLAQFMAHNTTPFATRTQISARQYAAFLRHFGGSVDDFAEGATAFLSAGATVRMVGSELQRTTVRTVAIRPVRTGMGFARALGVTTAASGLISFGVQGYLDYGDPFLTPGQKFDRAFTSGFIGAIAAGAGGAVALAFGGPIGLGVGFGLGLVGELWLAPRVFEARGSIPERRLQSLVQ